MNEKPLNTQPACTGPEYGGLHVDDAVQQILSTVGAVSGYEYVAIKIASGSVLDEKVCSSIDVPSHRNSAVDGYALDSESLPTSGEIGDIAIAGRALAGKPFDKKLGSEQCIRIMTGAALPDGSDTVIMQEHAEVKRDSIRIDDRHHAGQNVRQAGEDIRKGSVVFIPGKVLEPADIGLLASLGITEIRVKRKPRVAILSTGDEIHDVGETLVAGKIYDSNRYTLSSLLNPIGLRVIDLGIIPDNRASLEAVLTDSCRNVDLIISSGGASVGDADYVKELLAKLGMVQFSKVAVKPGRPLTFGKIGDAGFFGLPGNPVAVMVTYYQFVLPAIRRIMGITVPRSVPMFKAKSVDSIRKKPGRTEFQRGILEQTDNCEWIVRKTGSQGSGILTSMSRANAFIVLPHDGGAVKPGDFVMVQPFSGLLLP